MTKYKFQLLIVVASLVLLGCLFLLPNKSQYVTKTIPTNNVGVVSFTDILESEKKKLVAENKTLTKSILNLETEIASATSEKEKIALFDSLSRLCLFVSPMLSANYSYQKALRSHAVSDWVKAGDFFMLTAEAVIENEHQSVVNKAIESYEYAIQLDSNSTDNKVRLASAYVESGSNPMKGILLLREVVEKHPENIPAQFNLGLFSIKSQQFDKAISRFNKVLALDSSYYQAYYYLGQCELQLGNKQKAIEKFKYYQYLCTDTIEKQNIEQYINQLITT